MKKIKIFPKMFIQIFSVLGIIIILVHSLVYFIFPKTYLETRKEKIHNIANEISGNMNGKEIKYIEQTLELYSKSSEIKAFIKEKNNKNEIQIKDDINVNLESDSNSLIIEEREIKLNDGKKTNHPHIHFAVNAYSYYPTVPALTKAHFTSYLEKVKLLLRNEYPNTEVQILFKEDSQNV